LTTKYKYIIISTELALLTNIYYLFVSMHVLAVESLPMLSKALFRVMHRKLIFP
jgi:hypothetical protein